MSTAAATCGPAVTTAPPVKVAIGGAVLAGVVDSTDATETDDMVLTGSDVEAEAGVVADAVAGPVTVTPA
ncbi:hypothetical protein LTS03_004670 [Exophiala xenobiotica]|nr:hypothetical protein LTS03_004670 [Exophiala xenobiotica]KAK5389212.1 hypothetical protein LTR11_000021 [Exophiala xenobiotica]